jgi:hypothetical protein
MRLVRESRGIVVLRVRRGEAKGVGFVYMIEMQSREIGRYNTDNLKRLDI